MSGKQSFTVTDAAPEDEAVLAGMMRGLNEAENVFVPNRDLTEAAALEHVRYLLACAQEQGGFALIGRREGAALGFAIGLVETEDGTYVLPEHRRHGFLTDLYVAPEARGTGLAGALLAESEARFRALGLASLRLNVLDGNARARRFYDKAGYAPYERILSKPL